VTLLSNAPDFLQTIERTEGGQDIILGNTGQDLLVGGVDNDWVDGDQDSDLIFGDNLQILRRDGNVTSRRFQTLLGQVIYRRNDIPAFLQGLGALPTSQFDVGASLVDGVPRDYRDPDGAVPSWAQYAVVNLFHSFAIQAGTEDGFGDDYIAGGQNDDQIFGQLGDDVIQGDGSVDSAIQDVDPLPAGARRVVDALNPTITLSPTLPVQPRLVLEITPSFETADDGDDYIEGNGGRDVIFGNLGQDDIVGGSSNMFTLVTPDLRPDDSDIIFGGAGTRIEHDHDVTDANKDSIVMDDVHARDADMIAGDNANVIRLVGINGTEGEGVDTGSGDEFLTFQYDVVRDAQRVSARAVDLIDYTPGGPDFEQVSAATDIGGDDEVHGESGDDSIYGMMGKDILFGDSENDDLIGGWGPDWISGGQDMDGVIGDDGRIFTARYAELPGNTTSVADPANPTHYAELLHGIFKVDELDKEIRTPGDIQQAFINPSEIVNGQLVGEVFKVVDVTPFNLDPNTTLQNPLFEPDFANDVIFGGRGNDFLHGSAGDDAMLGAEALPDFFAAPINPDDPNTIGDDLLRFDATRIEFADYDEEFPRLKIEPFTLNFSIAGDPDPTIDANDNFDEDAMFGDLGNDWIVGGPDNDNMFGGWGADLLDADDDKDTNAGANDGPDPVNIDIQDRAYGGAGRDVLNANTGGDRLIDWVGEFNSFITPFAPFGAFTVTRAVFPQLFEFLYDLSESMGADPTRVADTGNDPDRNGEPDGEIGLIEQEDGSLWGDQTGAPIDPQPGNIPGGKRQTLRGVDFNDGTASGFAVDNGTWNVSGGRLEVAPSVSGEDAASVFHVGEYLPAYFEVLATVNGGKPTAGLKSNAYIVFDYQNPTDFRFAGVNISTNKLQMGHRDATGWHVDVQTPAQLRPDVDYDLLLAINGVTATLLLDNRQVFSHVYQPRTGDDGLQYGLNNGFIGLGAENSRARIDNVMVKVLAPEVTFDVTNEFTNEDSIDLLPTLVAGDWNVVGGRLDGTPGAGDSFAMRLSDLTVPPASLIVLETSFDASNAGGVVFDVYGPDQFKFVTFHPSTHELIIGHLSPRRGWVEDAITTLKGNTSGDHRLTVSLKGSTASVEVDGQSQLGYVFNAVTVDGKFGVISVGDTTSFDTFTLKTDGIELANPVAVLPAFVPGDVTFDGQFDSSDLLRVFQSGEYEDAISKNSSWEDGDWDGDGDFGTSDLAFALQVGNYVIGVRSEDEAELVDFDAELSDERASRELELLANQLRRLEIFGDARGDYFSGFADEDDQVDEDVLDAIAKTNLEDPITHARGWL
jgi:Ca2+-binding RTX toxin-like protein